MTAIRRIISWNIRAGGGKRASGILAQLLDWAPDVIGLSEFRGTSASQWLADELRVAGYAHQLATINPKHLAKNALLIASKYPLASIKAPRMPINRERWLLAQIESCPQITLGLMHVPNYTTPKLKYPFLNSVLKMIDRWDLGPGLLVGDTNCGKRGLDEENPQGPKFQREHDWIVGIEQRDFADVFRYLHGDRREYTWYSHRNNGFRLDYAFCSPQLRPAIVGLQHVWGVDPQQPPRREALSDHAAVIIDLTSGKV